MVRGSQDPTTMTVKIGEVVQLGRGPTPIYSSLLLTAGCED